MLIRGSMVPDEDPPLLGGLVFRSENSVSGIALAMNFGCRGDGRLGSRIIARTPRRVSDWFWWSADCFLGHRFSVENLAEMVILG